MSIPKLTLGQLTALATLVVVAAMVDFAGGSMSSPGGLSDHSLNKTPQGALRHMRHSRELLGVSRSAVEFDNDVRSLSELSSRYSEADGRREFMTWSNVECEAMFELSYRAQGAARIDQRFSFIRSQSHELSFNRKTCRRRLCEVSRRFDDDKLGTTSCVSCHTEPKNHVGVFHNRCAECHTTEKWSGSSFKHTFPINHAKAMNKNGCVTGHNPSESYVKYTCYSCHEHEHNKMIAKHRRVQLDKLDQCAVCHPDGKEKRRVGLDGLEGLLMARGGICLGGTDGDRPGAKP